MADEFLRVDGMAFATDPVKLGFQCLAGAQGMGCLALVLKSVEQPVALRARALAWLRGPQRA